MVKFLLARLVAPRWVSSADGCCGVRCKCVAIASEGCDGQDRGRVTKQSQGLDRVKPTDRRTPLLTAINALLPTAPAASARPSAAPRPQPLPPLPPPSRLRPPAAPLPPTPRAASLFPPRLLPLTAAVAAVPRLVPMTLAATRAPTTPTLPCGWARWWPPAACPCCSFTGCTTGEGGAGWAGAWCAEVQLSHHPCLTLARPAPAGRWLLPCLDASQPAAPLPSASLRFWPSATPCGPTMRPPLPPPHPSPLTCPAAPAPLPPSRQAGARQQQPAPGAHAARLRAGAAGPLRPHAAGGDARAVHGPGGGVRGEGRGAGAGCRAGAAAIGSYTVETVVVGVVVVAGRGVLERSVGMGWEQCNGDRPDVA